MGGMMKAVRYHSFGGPEVLRCEEVPIPAPGPEEVLIRVCAAAFNPADVSFCNGNLREDMALSLPHIPCFDVSGTVVETGRKAAGFRPGDKVFGFIDISRDGAAAEYVLSRAEDLAPASDAIPLAGWAAVTSSALTAWQGLFDHGHLGAGQRVLITAAAGGVGSLAVQMARWKGARVIGTASSRNFEKLTMLGVNKLIDYTRKDVEDQVKSPLDMIFNLAPAPPEQVERWLTLLRPGGVYVTIVQSAAAGKEQARQRELCAVSIRTRRSGAQLREIAALVDAGAVRPWVTERVPLERLADVHRHVGQTRGKVLIIIRSCADFF